MALLASKGECVSPGATLHLCWELCQMPLMSHGGSELVGPQQPAQALGW